MEFLLYSIVNSVWENMTQFHNILIGHALIQDSRWHKRPSRIQSFTWQHNSNVSNIFLFCFTWYLNTLVKNYSKMSHKMSLSLFTVVYLHEVQLILGMHHDLLTIQNEIRRLPLNFPSLSSTSKKIQQEIKCKFDGFQMQLVFSLMFQNSGFWNFRKNVAILDHE